MLGGFGFAHIRDVEEVRRRLRRLHEANKNVYSFYRVKTSAGRCGLDLTRKA